jgi:hypothetical protein
MATPIIPSSQPPLVFHFGASSTVIVLTALSNLEYEFRKQKCPFKFLLDE